MCQETKGNNERRKALSKAGANLKGKISKAGEGENSLSAPCSDRGRFSYQQRGLSILMIMIGSSRGQALRNYTQTQHTGPIAHTHKLSEMVCPESKGEQRF